MAILFDDVNRLITIESPATEITCQDLLNAIREFEYSTAGIDDPQVASAAGKEALGGGVYVGITVTLLNWTVKFEARTGPTWTLCTISGGNLVAVDDIGAFMSPIEPSAYVTVQITASSSATLQELSSIQYSSFGGGVTIDITNGSSGTAFPIGTIETPSNNIIDSTSIANERGFNTFFIHGNITLSNTVNLENFIIEGESIVRSKITIESAALVEGTEFRNATITGVLDGDNTLEHCAIQALNYVEGHIHSCLLEEYTITLGGTTDTIFLNCWSSGSAQDATPIIDLGGSGRGLIIRGHSGGLKFINKTGSDDAVLDFESGRVILDSTIMAGNITIRGIGQVEDYSTGTAVIDTDGVISQETISDAVWDEELLEHTTTGVTGNTLISTKYGGDIIIDTVNGVVGTSFPIGTRETPSNNLTDALIICNNYNIKRLRLRSNLTIENTHNISEMSIETRGLMGTTVTLAVGCAADNTAFRYLNLEGIVNNTDTLLVENCSIFNLENFTGIMQGVSFAQGSEITIGSWAELYNCRAGGEPTNEPEINIGTSVLNIQQYRGNIKLINKTGDNRTVVGCLPANVIVDSTCIAGKIQILGIGNIEADNSGAGCQVDVDAAITNEYIADAVWNENMDEHIASGTFGLIISDLIKLTGYKVTKSGDIITIYELDESTPWKQYNLSSGGRIEI